MKEIKLRFLELEDQNLIDSIVFEVESQDKNALKDFALKKLAINKEEGLTHLQSWLKAMSIENDIEFTIPVAKEIADAILFNKQVIKFMFFLA